MPVQKDPPEQGRWSFFEDQKRISPEEAKRRANEAPMTLKEAHELRKQIKDEVLRWGSSEHAPDWVKVERKRGDIDKTLVSFIDLLRDNPKLEPIRKAEQRPLTVEEWAKGQPWQRVAAQKITKGATDVASVAFEGIPRTLYALMDKDTLLDPDLLTPGKVPEAAARQKGYEGSLIGKGMGLVGGAAGTVSGAAHAILETPFTREADPGIAERFKSYLPYGETGGTGTPLLTRSLVEAGVPAETAQQATSLAQMPLEFYALGKAGRVAHPVAGALGRAGGKALRAPLEMLERRAANATRGDTGAMLARRNYEMSRSLLNREGALPPPGEPAPIRRVRGPYDLVAERRGPIKPSSDAFSTEILEDWLKYDAAPITEPVIRELTPPGGRRLPLEISEGPHKGEALRESMIQEPRRVLTNRGPTGRTLPAERGTGLKRTSLDDVSTEQLRDIVRDVYEVESIKQKLPEGGKERVAIEDMSREQLLKTLEKKRAKIQEQAAAEKAAEEAALKAEAEAKTQTFDEYVRSQGLRPEELAYGQMKRLHNEFETNRRAPVEPSEPAPAAPAAAPEPGFELLYARPPGTGLQDLTNLTKKQLLEVVKAEGLKVPGAGKAKKADLAEKIEAAREAKVLAEQQARAPFPTDANGVMEEFGRIQQTPGKVGKARLVSWARELGLTGDLEGGAVGDLKARIAFRLQQMGRIQWSAEVNKSLAAEMVRFPQDVEGFADWLKTGARRAVAPEDLADRRLGDTSAAPPEGMSYENVKPRQKDVVPKEKRSETLGQPDAPDRPTYEAFVRRRGYEPETIPPDVHKRLSEEYASTSKSGVFPAEYVATRDMLSSTGRALALGKLPPGVEVVQSYGNGSFFLLREQAYRVTGPELTAEAVPAPPMPPVSGEPWQLPRLRAERAGSNFPQDLPLRSEAPPEGPMAPGPGVGYQDPFPGVGSSYLERKLTSWQTPEPVPSPPNPYLVYKGPGRPGEHVAEFVGVRLPNGDIALPRGQTLNELAKAVESELGIPIQWEKRLTPEARENLSQHVEKYQALRTKPSWEEYTKGLTEEVPQGFEPQFFDRYGNTVEVPPGEQAALIKDLGRRQNYHAKVGGAEEGSGFDPEMSVRDVVDRAMEGMGLPDFRPDTTVGFEQVLDRVVQARPKVRPVDPSWPKVKDLVDSGTVKLESAATASAEQATIPTREPVFEAEPRWLREREVKQLQREGFAVRYRMTRSKKGAKKGEIVTETKDVAPSDLQSHLDQGWERSTVERPGHKREKLDQRYTRMETDEQAVNKKGEPVFDYDGKPVMRVEDIEYTHELKPSPEVAEMEKRGWKVLKTVKKRVTKSYPADIPHYEVYVQAQLGSATLPDGTLAAGMPVRYTHMIARDEPVFVLKRRDPVTGEPHYEKNEFAPGPGDILPRMPEEVPGELAQGEVRLPLTPGRRHIIGKSEGKTLRGYRKVELNPPEGSGVTEVAGRPVLRREKINVPNPVPITPSEAVGPGGQRLGSSGFREYVKVGKTYYDTHMKNMPGIEVVDHEVTQIPGGVSIKVVLRAEPTVLRTLDLNEFAWVKQYPSKGRSLYRGATQTAHVPGLLDRPAELLPTPDRGLVATFKGEPKYYTFQMYLDEKLQSFRTHPREVPNPDGTMKEYWTYEDLHYHIARYAEYLAKMKQIGPVAAPVAGFPALTAMAKFVQKSYQAWRAKRWLASGAPGELPPDPSVRGALSEAMPDPARKPHQAVQESLAHRAYRASFQQTLDAVRDGLQYGARVEITKDVGDLRTLRSKLWTQLLVEPELQVGTLNFKPWYIAERGAHAMSFHQSAILGQAFKELVRERGRKQAYADIDEEGAITRNVNKWDKFPNKKAKKKSERAGIQNEDWIPDKQLTPAQLNYSKKYREIVRVHREMLVENHNKLYRNDPDKQKTINDYGDDYYVHHQGVVDPFRTGGPKVAEVMLKQGRVKYLAKADQKFLSAASMRRTGAPNYKASVAYTVERVFPSVAHKIFMDRAWMEVKPAVETLLKETPNRAKLAVDFANHMFGRNQVPAITRGLEQVFHQVYLGGGNLTSAVTNFAGGFYMLATKVNPIQAVRALAHVARRAGQGLANYTPKDGVALELDTFLDKIDPYLREQGVTHTSGVDPSVGGRVLKAAGRASLAPFRWTEYTIRRVSASAAWFEGRAKGLRGELPGEPLFEYVQDMLRYTQQHYGRSTHTGLYRMPHLRMAGHLGSWTVKWWNTIARNIKSGDWGAATKQILYATAAAWTIQNLLEWDADDIFRGPRIKGIPVVGPMAKKIGFGDLTFPGPAPFGLGTIPEAIITAGGAAFGGEKQRDWGREYFLQRVGTRQAYKVAQTLTAKEQPGGMESQPKYPMSTLLGLRAREEAYSAPKNTALRRLMVPGQPMEATRSREFGDQLQDIKDDTAEKRYKHLLAVKMAMQDRDTPQLERLMKERPLAPGTLGLIESRTRMTNNLVKLTTMSKEEKLEGLLAAGMDRAKLSDEDFRTVVAHLLQGGLPKTLDKRKVQELLVVMRDRGIR